MGDVWSYKSYLGKVGETILVGENRPGLVKKNCPWSCIVPKGHNQSEVSVCPQRLMKVQSCSWNCIWLFPQQICLLRVRLLNLHRDLMLLMFKLGLCQQLPFESQVACSTPAPLPCWVLRFQSWWRGVSRREDPRSYKTRLQRTMYQASAAWILSVLVTVPCPYSSGKLDCNLEATFSLAGDLQLPLTRERTHF